MLVVTCIYQLTTDTAMYHDIYITDWETTLAQTVIRISGSAAKRNLLLQVRYFVAIIMVGHSIVRSAEPFPPP